MSDNHAVGEPSSEGTPEEATPVPEPMAETPVVEPDPASEAISPMSPGSGQQDVSEAEVEVEVEDEPDTYVQKLVRGGKVIYITKKAGER